MTKYKRRNRKTVSVSDLANYAADPDSFYDYKTKKNHFAIKKGLIAHGDNYKSSKATPALVLIIAIMSVAISLYLFKVA